ncbi:MAG: SH3 domain-containing protein [Bacteroidota bacterium]
MRKEVFLIQLLILALCTLGKGQPVTEPSFVLSTVERYYFPDEAPLHYLLADQVSLRDAPSTQAKRMATLPIGTPMLILERGKILTRIKGIDAHWYRVQVKEKEGWIWGGLIAQQAFGSSSDPSLKFVAGLAKIEMDHPSGRRVPSYQIRAFRDNQEVARIEIASLTFSIGPAQNFGPKGIPGVQEVLAIHMPCGEGCGCLTGDFILFWDGSEFHNALQVTGTPDGAYSEGATIIFPVDMEGRPEQIIKITSAPGEEYPEADLGPEIERVLTTEYFRWDGKQVVPDSTPTKVERYRIPID